MSSDKLPFHFHMAVPYQYRIRNKTKVEIYDLRLKTRFTNSINQSCLILPASHFIFTHNVLRNSDEPIKPNQSLARSVAAVTPFNP